MKNYLVLIDNQPEELDTLKKELEKNASEKDVLVESICCKCDKQDGVELFKVFLEKIKRNNNTSNMKISVIVDICLTKDEEDRQSLKGATISGVECLKEIDQILKDGHFDYKLFLMSRFFSQQADDIESIQQSIAGNAHFVAVIKKPLLENGKIDKGTSEFKQYMSLLPEDKLSYSYLQSFINIVFFSFEE